MSQAKIDGAALGQKMVEAVKTYIERAAAALTKRIDQQAARQESTDQILVDLERRIEELEGKR